MDWKKISVFAPMLSVAVVGGCIWMTLGRYTPPVYEVEARESIAEEVRDVRDEDAVKEDEKEENAAAGEFDLENGVYRGVGNGFAGTITVSVEIKDKKIAAINILDVEGDDAAFFNRAKGVIDKIIDSQSLDVDVVSGATYSSRGIISAVKNALTGEKDSSESPGTASAGSTAAGSTSVGYVQESGTYRDGTYYGTGTGFGGQLTVKVDISGGKIVSIQITHHNDGSSYIQKASGLISNIIAAQSTNVDTVSGATYSSAGIIEAVRNALKQATIQNTANNNNSNNNNNEENNNSSQDQPNATAPSGTVPYIEGIYYGTGEGYMGELTVAVVIQDKTIKAILITENEGDDEAFLDRAKAVVSNVVKQQNTEVDLVSGATYSSRGLLEAITNALEEAKKATDAAQNPENPGEDDKNPDDSNNPGKDDPNSDDPDNPWEDDPNPDDSDNPWEDDPNPADPDNPGGDGQDPGNPGGGEQNPDNSGGDDLNPADPGEDGQPEEGDVYFNGEYTTQVFCEPDEYGDFDTYILSLKMTIQNDQIVSITDIQGDGDPLNNSYINRAANGTSKIPGVVAQILEKNSIEGIDTVSRATCSSNAIIEACRLILESAGR